MPTDIIKFEWTIIQCNISSNHAAHFVRMYSPEQVHAGLAHRSHLRPHLRRLPRTCYYHRAERAIRCQSANMSSLNKKKEKYILKITNTYYRALVPRTS